MGEFSVRDVVGPRSRVVSTEDPKVGFDLLVYSFSFSVGLRMIGSRKGKVIFQEFSKFMGKGGCELRASVGDNFVIGAKVEIYFVEE